MRQGARVFRIAGLTREDKNIKPREPARQFCAHGGL
jgi:hypothetical protein